MRLTRQRRAQLARQAARIRADAQRSVTPVPVIVDEIRRRIPDLTQLEAWRLAYGWSRPEVLDAIADLYIGDGLLPPAVTTAMLCRWEHAQSRPSPEYVHALSRVYGAPIWRLGLTASPASPQAWYGRPIAEAGQGASVDRNNLRAVADSVALAFDIEGPAGGPQALDTLHQALAHYVAHYGDHPPAVLATEVHRCRTLVVDALRADPPQERRRELRRAAGWLSALLGNLAFHAGDVSGSHIHLGASARLGVDVGEHHLTCWSLAAHSMVAFYENRDTEALDLAEQATLYADAPLRRAQIAAWAHLRPLARLGDRDQADRTAASARRYMDTAVEDHGRFGFDTAELHLHLAEAALDLTDPIQAATHAEESRALKPSGSGGWAAATAVLARSHALLHRVDDAVALAATVLDTVPAQALRFTTRARLDALLVDLRSHRAPGRQARELGDRLAVLSRPPVSPRTSPEPNGD